MPQPRARHSALHSALAVLMPLMLGMGQKAQAQTSPVPRSDAEAAVGGIGAGLYLSATTLWATSLLSEARWEYRLLPAVALGVAGAWAVTAYDREHPFASGTLANTVSGATVGLAIAGAWVLHNQAGDGPWKPSTAATLLWSGATLGAGIGALTSQAGTTPGRAAFTTAGSLWTATMAGLLAASLGDARTAERRGFLGAAIAMEVGVIAAGWLGRRWHPTLQRVALASALAVVGGATVAAGTWIGTGRPQLDAARATWAAGALGVITGGLVGWAWP